MTGHSGQGTSRERPIIKKVIGVNENTMSASRTNLGQCSHEEQSALDYLDDHLEDDEEHQFTIIGHTQRDGSTAVGKGREELKVKEQPLSLKHIA